jgi:hypothetical protein
VFITKQSIGETLESRRADERVQTLLLQSLQKLHAFQSLHIPAKSLALDK